MIEQLKQIDCFIGYWVFVPRAAFRALVPILLFKVPIVIQAGSASERDNIKWNKKIWNLKKIHKLKAKCVKQNQEPPSAQKKVCRPMSFFALVNHKIN